MVEKKLKLLNISQVALLVGLVNKKNNKLQTHTLRFWETKFKQLRPTILSGRRRYYSSRDIQVVKNIFFLLKNQGLTINGARKLMGKYINPLDDKKRSSIKAEYLKNKIKEKSKKILQRIKKLNG